MLIGVPKEIKNHEYRVGLTPTAVREAVHHGHGVVVETNASAAADVFAKADMIVKVNEPQAGEIAMLRHGQVLFTYLHLAPDPDQTKGLMASCATAIAYETVTDNFGGLPLLAPMSEVAGRMAIQAGAHCLEMYQCGRGALLGGVAGVPAADVLILGGGVVGSNAERIAIGSEARVTVIDLNICRLKELDDQFGASLNTIYSTVDSIEKTCDEFRSGDRCRAGTRRRRAPSGHGGDGQGHAP